MHSKATLGGTSAFYQEKVWTVAYSNQQGEKDGKGGRTNKVSLGQRQLKSCSFELHGTVIVARRHPRSFHWPNFSQACMVLLKDSSLTRRFSNISFMESRAICHCLPLSQALKAEVLVMVFGCRDTWGSVANVHIADIHLLLLEIAARPEVPRRTSHVSKAFDRSNTSNALSQFSAAVQTSQTAVYWKRHGASVWNFIRKSSSRALDQLSLEASIAVE